MASAAIVLCGGRSTRMGRAKAWLPWHGRPMIAHVVESLRVGGTVDEVVVVSSDELELPTLEATIVCDRQPALGPLAGIREGLAHIKADLAYVTSTDAPFLTAGFVAAMLAYGGAAAPEIDGYVQTLAAVYPREGLSRADALLAANKLRPLGLLEAVGYRKVPANELPDTESIRGFNTPDEYLQAVKQDAPGATAVLELRGAALRAAGGGPRGHSPSPSGAHPTAFCEWEVPVGTLGEALGQVPGLNALEGALEGEGVIAARFAVSLGGGESIRDPRVPIGPGERVVVSDSGT